MHSGKTLTSDLNLKKHVTAKPLSVNNITKKKEPEDS